MKDAFFEGWYWKQQSATDTLALILARHAQQGEQETASLQIVTPEGALSVPMPKLAVRRGKGGAVRSGNSWFGRSGLRLCAEQEGVSLHGTLRFSAVRPPRFDIMGPFVLVPGMECRHSVFSLRHRVEGALTLNGKVYRFANGAGYIEGDRGRSFPRRYLWTQALLGAALTDSVMLSVAEIPVGKGCFTGTIASLLLGGKEYRLATYLGAHVTAIGWGEAQIRQGEYLLTVRCLSGAASGLAAPTCGGMQRRIREGLCCRAAYRFQRGNRVLLDCICENASFEDEWR